MIILRLDSSVLLSKSNINFKDERIVKNNYNQIMELNCLLCYGKNFDNTDYTTICKNCKRAFTRHQLQEVNSSKISATVKKTKKELFNDIDTNFYKIFRKFFWE
jgi:hypothetical protein